MIRIKLLADENIRRSIVLGVRQRGPAVDILTARDAGALGLPDPEVLALGSSLLRVVVSSDQSTMPGHYWRFIEANDSPGMIIVPQSVELSRAIDELLRIWIDSAPGRLNNQIRWVKSRN